MELQGEVVEVIYKNEINSYCIAVFKLDKDSIKQNRIKSKKSKSSKDENRQIELEYDNSMEEMLDDIFKSIESETTIVGYLPFVNIGDTLKVVGKFVEHPEYGTQFKVDTFEKMMPQTTKALENYLANCGIKGIGPATAKNIVDTFSLEPIKAKKVIVNKTSYLEESAYFDGIQYNIYHYELLADTGLELKIQDSPLNWDNMTVNGLFLKDNKCYAQYNQDCVSNYLTIRMDMPNNESSYRFDFYAEEDQTGNNTQLYNRTINFYHKDYGYVTVDISFLENNEQITSGQKITMKFQDKDCIFSIDEFGTSNFNCDDYQDYPVN